MSYLIEKDGARECVNDLEGYEGWTVIAEGADAQPIEHGEWTGDCWAIPLATKQAWLWEAVKGIRETLQNGVCLTPVGEVQIDEHSKLKISGIVQMALIAQLNAQAFEEHWTLADNSVATLDAPTAIQVGIAVGQFVSACHVRSRELNALIYAEGAAEEDLESLDITVGWP